jgi:NADPH:quinone reductase-like Zn-dependent oxidoreductase
VEGAGEKVADLRDGDEVYVYSGGCYAEYVFASALTSASNAASLATLMQWLGPITRQSAIMNHKQLGATP